MFHHFVGKVYVFHQPPPEELPFVDFPLFTQEDSAPESMLIQLDVEDLKDKSKKRLSNIFKQSLLPLDLLKQNAGIDPEAQIRMAPFLRPVIMKKLNCYSGNNDPHGRS